MRLESGNAIRAASESGSRRPASSSAPLRRPMLVRRHRRCPPVPRHRSALHRVVRGQTVLRASRGGRARFVRAGRAAFPAGRRQESRLHRMTKRKLLIGCRRPASSRPASAAAVLPALRRAAPAHGQLARRDQTRSTRDVPPRHAARPDHDPRRDRQRRTRSAPPATRPTTRRPRPLRRPTAATPRRRRPRPPRPRSHPAPAPGRPGAYAPAERPDAPGHADRPATRRTSRRRAQGDRHHARAAAGDGRLKARSGETARAGREGRKADAQGRTGAPTPADPTFSLALPGPAPIGVPNFFIDKFRIPPFLLPIYQAAGIQYGVRWEVLAAINEIETDYGRNLNVSTAGAVGWMQFLPSTWKRYGVDANDDGRKDPYNPVDAIFAAARYLKAAGADQDLRKAIFAYNHADWYVDSVLLRARLIGGLPADLVGSLTGLTQGHFPVARHGALRRRRLRAQDARNASPGHNAAVPVEADDAPRASTSSRRPARPSIAVQDGKIVAVGTNRAPRPLRPAARRLRQHLHLRAPQEARQRLPGAARSARSPRRPSSPSSSSRRRTRRRPRPPRPASSRRPARRQATPRRPRTTRRAAKAPRRGAATKERLFANPSAPERLQGRRPGAAPRRAARPLGGSSSFKSYFTQVYGLKRSDVVLKPLKVGSRVIAGTILGRIGRTSATRRPARPLRDPPGGQAARRSSTPSRSSTAGSCSSRPRSTAPRARTRSSGPTRRTRRSARSC